MELFKDRYLLTKEYFEKKPKTPDEETLTQQLNLTSSDKKDEEPEEEKEVPGRFLGHEVLSGKIVGLYFSAGWCPPCQQFTPLLGEVYEELKTRKANFEVVFLSFDNNETDMENYFRTKHKNWYAVPFDDPYKDELKIKYNVTAVPKFIVVHKNGEVLTSRGRKEVQDKGVICFRNWQQTSSIYEAKLNQTSALGDANNNATNGNGETVDSKKEPVEPEN